MLCSKGLFICGVIILLEGERGEGGRAINSAVVGVDRRRWEGEEAETLKGKAGN